jgi:hypothetical protein
MLRIGKKYQPEGWYFYFWLTHQDLNLEPADYEPCFNQPSFWKFGSPYPSDPTLSV